MPTHFKKSFSTSSILIIFFVCLSQNSWAACDQTLSPGANVASAISNAAAGTTICLNAGNYGTVTVSNVSKSSDVIIQSTTGQTANANFSLSNTNHIKVQSMTIYSLYWSGGTNNTFSKNLFVGDGGAWNSHSSMMGTGQIVYNSGGNSSAKNLIDGNTFSQISVCSNCYEGWISLQPGNTASGITISNNTFSGPGDGDFIQTGTSGVVIGPGNSFIGNVQSWCDTHSGRHCDSIQGYGQDHTIITGNYFSNDTVFVGNYDGGTGDNINNNVFVGNDQDAGQIMLGSSISDIVEHNTFIGMAIGLDAKSGGALSSNGIVRNNIFLQNSRIAFNCTGCVASYNLADASSVTTCAAHGSECTFGSNLITGTPTFTGGSSYTKAWAGWQLLSSSLGYKQGSDGLDRGTTFYGVSIVQLEPPKNLRVQ
ncbi:MAG: hypothetical protein ACXVCR_02700 [Bdellovibrio sp.]